VTSTPSDGSSNAASGGRGGLIAAGILGVLAAAYVALVLASGSGVPRNATVLGIDVGGQSAQEAAATVTKALGAASTAPIEATADGKHISISPAQAGLSFDANATFAPYTGRTWNPVTLLSQFTGGVAIAPTVVVDETKMSSTIKGIAGDFDKRAREPQIAFTALAPAVVPGKPGTVLDQKAAEQALKDAYLVAKDPVTLPFVTQQPTVTDEQAKAALDGANIAVSAPVSVTASGITGSIPPETIAAALSYAPKDGKLIPTLDGNVLRTAIASTFASVEQPGRDATFNVSSGTPVVVPSKVGTGINAEDLATDVAAVLGQTDAAARHVDARTGTIEPKLTTEQAKSLGVTEQMSSFTQHFPYAPYRVQNIGQAAKYINGTLLMPGDVFSLNDTIHERTVANGYTLGYVIGPGGVFKEDLGGGVSTSATATWSAAFYAGLQRVHVQAHSIWIPRYRAGLEATVAWGQFDMSFKNDTPHAVFISAGITRHSITVSMWGTKVYDKVKAESGQRYGTSPYTTLYDTSSTCHAQGGQEGFSIDVYRVFYKDGKEDHREKITTHYNPSPVVHCYADPSIPKPTPSGSAQPTGAPHPSPSGSAHSTPTAHPTSTPKPSPKPSASSS
jgi:vancomycin resistance protein YoaR